MNKYLPYIAMTPVIITFIGLIGTVIYLEPMVVFTGISIGIMIALFLWGLDQAV